MSAHRTAPHLLDEVRLHLPFLEVEYLHGLDGGQLARPGHGLGALDGAGSRICVGARTGWVIATRKTQGRERQRDKVN